MAVIRVHKTKDYTVMSNNHFKEKEMTYKAKGVLSVMLSLPDDWDYSTEGLAALSSDGRDSVKSALEELEKFGYLKRTQAFDERGRFAGYDYDIYEFPFEIPSTEKPQAETPSTDFPSTEKPQQLNTNISSTNELSTKDKKKERKNNSYDEILSSVEDESLRELYLEYIKMRKLNKSQMTDRALEMLINKVNKLEPYDIERQKKLLENAIVGNWKSVYPLKDNNAGNQPKSTGNVFLDMLGE